MTLSFRAFISLPFLLPAHPAARGPGASPPGEARRPELPLLPGRRRTRAAPQLWTARAAGRPSGRDVWDVGL